MRGNQRVLLSNEEDLRSANSCSMPAWKRSLDVGAILVALPFLVPLTLILAGLIKCLSRGPVMFRQERVGHQGRRFVCCKFRTMKLNADTETHRQHLVELMRSDVPMVKLDEKGDQRLIPLGSFLRATGLDELPQLLNVLRGEMSIVGPRPCLPYEYENYQPRQKRRFDAVPGLTGLWQVSGKNKTTFAEMINLDIFYAKNQSLKLDVAIMLRTPPALISQVVEVRGKRRLPPPGLSRKPAIMPTVETFSQTPQAGSSRRVLESVSSR